MSNHKPSTRDNLLETAEQQYADKGFYGTSINDVAKALGLTKQGLLHHFPTKEKLYAAVLEGAVAYLTEHFHRVVESVDDPRDQVIAVCTSFDAENTRLVRVSRLLVRELLDNLKRAESAHHWFLTPLMKQMESIVLAGQASGVFKPVHAMAFIYQILGAQQYFIVSLPTLKQMYDEATYQSHLDNHASETIRIIRSTLFVS